MIIILRINDYFIIQNLQIILKGVFFEIQKDFDSECLLSYILFIFSAFNVFWEFTKYSGFKK